MYNISTDINPQLSNVKDTGLSLMYLSHIQKIKGVFTFSIQFFFECKQPIKMYHIIDNIVYLAIKTVLRL